MCVPLYDAFQSQVAEAVSQSLLPQLHVFPTGDAGEHHDQGRALFTPAPGIRSHSLKRTRAEPQITHPHTAPLIILNPRNMSDKLTALESGLALIYGTFVKYASSEEGDDPTTISKKELCQMIAEQLPHLAGNDMAEQVMMELDSDLDGTLNFLEYCSFITSLSMILHIIVSGDLS
ncbi:unnamed protein product [Boreogadus saida]